MTSKWVGTLSYSQVEVLDELTGDTHNLGCAHQHIFFPNRSHIQVPGTDSSDVAGNCGANIPVMEDFLNV